MLQLWIIVTIWSVVGAVDRPIIGIMSQEFSDGIQTNYTSYIPAPYVKAVESSGAQVVPIFIKRPTSYYRDILNRINGVVFPGGGADLNAKGGVVDASAIIFDIAKQMNRRGQPMPILGVCQGFEILAYLSNNRNDFLVNCSGEPLNLPLKFKPGFRNSSLYRQASDEEIYILSNLPVTANHHHKCLTEKALKRTGLLDTSWRVLSTNVDLHGLEFISSMESVKYPFAAVQFHPEKNAYEWNPAQKNPHGMKAVKSARYFYDWLVQEAHRSNATFPDEESLSNSLIYNYMPLYSGKFKFYDTQVYCFN